MTLVYIFDTIYIGGKRKMKDNKPNYTLIIFIAIIVILFIPIISDYVKKQSIEVLSSAELKQKIESGESILVYVGDLEKEVQRDLRKLRDAVKNDYSYQYGVYNVKDSKDIKSYLGDNVKVAIIVEGDIQEIYSEYEKEDINENVNEFLLANINEDNRNYEVANNFNEYKKTIKGQDIIMSVFGRNTCSYCNKFKVVYNAVADKYDLEDNIYYFDSDSYNAKEYKKIVNLDLTIPAKCSSDGNSFKLSDGFGTPLTIFTKNGRVVDCQSGYVNRKELIEILKNVDMISE